MPNRPLSLSDPLAGRSWHDRADRAACAGGQRSRGETVAAAGRPAGSGIRRDRAFWHQYLSGPRVGQRHRQPEGVQHGPVDPAHWARASKAAGGKSLLLVAKHHGGFSLYPSPRTGSR
ncbi:alpha-L-fucosidase [Xanthomonas bundabergensis]|uniref:alpha-L-fucosidase n=1 Tax=Xanthomonas bundabergensis TaxID=3160842 RepID=UPI003515B513